MIWSHPLFWVGVAVTGVLFPLILSELPFAFSDRRVKFTMDGFTFNSRRIDKSTGFPKVPAGWYWQVKKVPRKYSDDNELDLGLVDSSGKTRAETFVSIDSRYSVQHQLRDESRTVLWYLECQYKQEDIHKFVGNYPPKGLKK